MRILLSLALVLGCCLTAWADIECKEVYQPNEPIVVKVAPTGVPEGAKLRGSLQVTDASYLQPVATESVFYVWAAKGTHTVTATGVWVLTDTGELGGKLVDFGMYTFTRTFVVGEGDDPVPPPQPGDRRAVILEETLERTPAFAVLRQQLIKQLPPERLQILDDDLPAASSYLPMVKPEVRPALLVLEGNRLIRAIACPSSVAGVEQELAR